jgi:Asp-tRNA(Asn)/Glu-tRNA(Gln) amidotransferase A subunit family amidase
MTKAELPGLTIVELQRLLRAGEVTAREVLEALHERIEAIDPRSTPIFRAIWMRRWTRRTKRTSTCR